MLNLAAATEPAWIERALADFDAVLLDHAHCEKKAAGAAVKLLFRYPDQGFLLAPLAALAQEELGHFRRVLTMLGERDVCFERQRPSAYGGRLHELIRHEEPDRLLDVLLVSALIEARSCERFQCLAQAHPDPEVVVFYEELVACEAKHHGVYLGLARQLMCDETEQRLAELALAEAEILQLRSSRVRLHS